MSEDFVATQRRVSPAELIKAEVASRYPGLSVYQLPFAEIVRNDIWRIFKGERILTPRAKRLGKAFGTSAQFWINFDQGWREGQ